jgi:hypothetical protein
MKTQETTQEMRDNIQVLIYKKPKDKDLKVGQMVCYQNRNGIYAFLGTITDIIVKDNTKHYLINTSMGAYLADELRLIKD